MGNTHSVDDEPFSPASGERIFHAWCEANTAMAHSTALQAEQRLKALENLWRAWRKLFANRFGYDKTMPEAIKAMDRSDKSLMSALAEHAHSLDSACCSDECLEDPPGEEPGVLPSSEGM